MKKFLFQKFVLLFMSAGAALLDYALKSPQLLLETRQSHVTTETRPRNIRCTFQTAHWNCEKSVLKFKIHCDPTAVELTILTANEMLRGEHSRHGNNHNLRKSIQNNRIWKPHQCVRRHCRGRILR